jgi:hypothetical protein
MAGIADEEEWEAAGGCLKLGGDNETLTVREGENGGAGPHADPLYGNLPAKIPSTNPTYSYVQDEVPNGLPNPPFKVPNGLIPRQKRPNCGAAAAAAAYVGLASKTATHWDKFVQQCLSC